MRVLAAILLFLATCYWLFGPEMVNWILFGSPSTLYGIVIGICFFYLVGSYGYRHYHDGGCH